MTVKEFCEKYGLKFQTVYKKIKNHKDKELAGHITKTKGASLELDDFAVDFLLPLNVKILQAVTECEEIVIENDELKEKLYSAENSAAETEEKLTAAQSEIDSAKASLAEKESELTALKNELETRCQAFRQTIAELEKRVAELTEENRQLMEKLETVPKFFRKNP